MKRSIITILIAITAMMAVHAQEKVIKPQSITPMPKISVEQWEKLSNQYEDDSEELWKYGDITVYDDGNLTYGVTTRQNSMYNGSWFSACDFIVERVDD